jgi:membrane protease subunit (stomatin/prohibitin family)
MVQTSVWAQSFGLNDLKGKWTTTNGAGIHVVDSNQVFLLYQGERKETSSVSLNMQSKPAYLDFHVVDSTGNTKIQSIFQFVNSNLIQWQVFEGERPLNFTASRGELLFLRRSD